MKREQMRAKLEKAAARDHTAMRQWSERRYRRVREGMENPLAPRLERLARFGMLTVPPLAAVYDLIQASRPGGPGMGRALHNAALSFHCMWSLFAAVLVPCCVVQLVRGLSHPWYEKHSLRRNGKPRMAPRMRCRIWLIVAFSGIIVSSLLLFIGR